MEKYTKKFEKLEKSAVKMTLTFTAAAVDADYQAQLAKYAKQLTINGFRKGKAPVSVIESKYGETVLNETFTDMLDKAVQEVFNPEDEKNAVAKEFQPIDSRALDLVNEEAIFPIKKGQDVVCEVKYDVYPEFEIAPYKGLKIEYSVDDYDPKVEEDEIENIRSRNAVISEKKTDVAEPDDIATIDLCEIAEDGSEIAETQKNDFVFTIAKEPAAPYEIDADVAGMKVGDVKTVEKQYDKQSAYPEEKKTWKVVLKKLKVRTLPALDDDFAQDVSDAYKSMDDMRKDIHSKNFEQYGKQVENVKIEAALNSISKNTEIAVPETMIESALEEKWYGFVQNFTGNGQRSYADAEKMLASQGVTRESYSSMMGDRFGEENISEIKKTLILDKIEALEKTEVTDDAEVAKFIEDNKIDTKMYGDAYEQMVKDNIKVQMGKDNAIKYVIDNNEFVKVEPKPAAEPAAEAAEPAKADK